MIYKTPLDAYNAWKKNIQVVTPNIITEMMKDSMQEAVRYSVYARYSPTQYTRREENGGLADKRNMIENVEVSDNKIIVTLCNDRKDEDTMRYVDDIVVTGVGYTWEKSKIYQMQPYPRDFYEETIKILSTPENISLMKEKMKSAGINIK